MLDTSGNLGKTTFIFIRRKNIILNRKNNLKPHIIDSNLNLIFLFIYISVF